MTFATWGSVWSSQTPNEGRRHGVRLQITSDGSLTRGLLTVLPVIRWKSVLAIPTPVPSLTRSLFCNTTLHDRCTQARHPTTGRTSHEAPRNLLRCCVCDPSCSIRQGTFRRRKSWQTNTQWNTDENTQELERTHTRTRTMTTQRISHCRDHNQQARYTQAQLLGDTLSIKTSTDILPTAQRMLQVLRAQNAVGTWHSCRKTSIDSACMGRARTPGGYMVQGHHSCSCREKTFLLLLRSVPLSSQLSQPPPFLFLNHRA